MASLKLDDTIFHELFRACTIISIDPHSHIHSFLLFLFLFLFLYLFIFLFLIAGTLSRAPAAGSSSKVFHDDFYQSHTSLSVKHVYMYMYVLYSDTFLDYGETSRLVTRVFTLFSKSFKKISSIHYSTHSVMSFNTFSTRPLND